MFLSLFIVGSWVGGGFLSTSHLCRLPPSPQHQQPQITFHRTIAMTLIIPNYPPDFHIPQPLSLVTLFSSGWLSLPKFPSFPTKYFLLCKFLFSLHCIVFIKLEFHLFGWWTGWTSIIKAKRKSKGAPAARGWNLFASDFSSQTF